MEDISGSWQLAQPYGARQGPTSTRSLARGRSDAASIPRFPPAPEVWQGDSLAWAGSLSLSGPAHDAWLGGLPDKTKSSVRSPCVLFLCTGSGDGALRHGDSWLDSGPLAVVFWPFCQRQVPTSTRSLAWGLTVLASTALFQQDRFPPALAVWHGDSTA